MKHVMGLIATVAVLTVVTDYVLEHASLFPVQASAESVTVDSLFRLQLYVIGFLFALIAGLMLYSAVVFRRRAGDTSDGAHIHGNTALEITWTILPTIVVIWFGVHTAGLLTAMKAPEKDELQINVHARQWSFEFEYPDSGFSSPELFVPVDQQIDFHVTSEDVIHDFFVPEFRIKQDAVPGVWHELRITPSKVTGSLQEAKNGQDQYFQVRCAEICGNAPGDAHARNQGHSFMLAYVHVLTQADYHEWLDEQVAIANDPAKLGEQLYRTKTCFACHSIDGSKSVGPTWKGLFGSEVELTNDTSVRVDEAYLRESIMSPNAKIVEGFPANTMPQNFGETLKPAEIDALIAFIESLGEGAPPHPVPGGGPPPPAPGQPGGAGPGQSGRPGPGQPGGPATGQAGGTPATP